VIAPPPRGVGAYDYCFTITIARIYFVFKKLFMNYGKRKCQLPAGQMHPDY